MITIYHNPRCSKSREGVCELELLNQPFETVKYLEKNFSKTELLAIIEKLGIQPIDLIRKNEAIWKEHYKGQTLTDNQVIDAMLKHPNLIERPIVVNGNKAVIARPKDRIKEIL